MRHEDHQQPADDLTPLTRREIRERERQELAQRMRQQDTGPSEAPVTVPAPHSTAAAPLPEAVAERDPMADMFDETRSEPPAGRRRGRGRVGCIVVLITVLVLAGAAWVGWSMFGDRVLAVFGIYNDDYEGTGNGVVVEFSVLTGDTGTSIADRLEDEDIIKSADAFVREALSRADEPQFQPGTYLMQEEMSSQAALDVLLDEQSRVENTVTIPEGTVAKDVYALVEANLGIAASELEAAAADPQSYGVPEQAQTLEGFLFPATYTFEPGTDATTVLQTMVDRTYQSLDTAGVSEDGVWDVIRMASLVEKEARITEDFYKVARVFYNRLDIDMPLQSDATVTYGTGEYDRAATTDDERNDASNPYNTYVHTGMIPGPISNPGDLAIDAALNPAEGDWLYFVTVNLETGETVFSSTYEEHERAVAQWLAWLEEHPDYG